MVEEVPTRTLNRNRTLPHAARATRKEIDDTLPGAIHLCRDRFGNVETNRYIHGV